MLYRDRSGSSTRHDPEFSLVNSSRSRASLPQGRRGTSSDTFRNGTPSHPLSTRLKVKGVGKERLYSASVTLIH